MTEDGYDNEAGFKALDRTMQKFWENVDIEFVQKRDITEFQFSEVMKLDFRIIKVLNNKNRNNFHQLSQELIARKMNWQELKNKTELLKA